MEILKKILQVSICFFIILGVGNYSFGASDNEKTLQEIQQQIIALRNEFKLRLQKAENDRLTIQEHIQTKLEELINQQQSSHAGYPEFKEKVEKLRTLLDTHSDKIATLEQIVNTIESTMNTHLGTIEKQIAALQRRGIGKVPELTPIPDESQPEESHALDFAPGELFRAVYRIYMEGDYETAIAGFQKFLADYPNHQLVGAAQYWIAESFAKLEEYELAIQEYDHLIKTYPQNDKIADAYYGKGLALLRLGRFNEAGYHFTYVVEHFPETGAAQKARNRLEELR